MWTDIEEALARIDSMDAGAAAGDAAEIRRIVAAARAVADRLASAFAQSDVLSGSAADASTASGTALASQMGASVEGLQTGAGALDAASSALAASIGQRERIAGLVRVGSMPEARIAVSSALQGLMTASYNMPMSSSTSGIVDLGSPASTPSQASGTSAGDDVGLTPSYGGGPVDSALRPDPVTADPTNATGTVAPTGPVDRRTESARDAPATDSGAPDRTGSATAATSVATPDQGTGRRDSGPAGSGPAPSGPVAVTGVAGRTAVSPQSVTPVLAGTPGARLTGVPAVGAGPTSPSAAMRTPGTPAVSAATPSAVASTAARSTPATPAMGSGAVRRKDDDEHVSAAYLRSRREGELLLGTPPMVTSAVIPPPILDDGDLPVNAGDATTANGVDGDADQKLDPTL